MFILLKAMERLLKTLKALADPTRLRIILLLLERDLCVCELTYILKMSQSRVSHQLRILRDAGLAEDKRDGKWMIYGLPRGARGRLRPLLGLSDRDEAAKSAGAIRDLDNLRICLMKDIRRSRKPPHKKLKRNRP